MRLVQAYQTLENSLEARFDIIISIEYGEFRAGYEEAMPGVSQCD